MNLNNKKILRNMNSEINKIYFKIKHKNLEKVKNEISRRGKITFCRGRLFAPYILAFGTTTLFFSMLGATPFLLDKSKNYQKIMDEIDNSENVRIIRQFDDFEIKQNFMTVYSKWQKGNDNYFRNIIVYKLCDISEDKMFKLLHGDVTDLEEIFGSPISVKEEERIYLDKMELEKDAYISFRIYSEKKDDFIFINQPIENNVIETVLWLIVMFIAECGAFFYRCLSSFNYNKMVKKINQMYSINFGELLEKRLGILENNYRILNQHNNFIDDSIVSKFLDSNNKIKLSKLSYNELRTILIISMGTELVLRDKLTFNDNYLFGMEIELEHVRVKKLKKNLAKIKNLKWSLTKDISLQKGIEIVSPIMSDTDYWWYELNNVCYSTNNLAFIDKNCGLHVHVGAHVLGRNSKAWLNFIKLYATYENVVFRFAYGEFYNYRDSIMDFAPPISSELWKDYIYLINNNADLEEILFTIKHGKYNAINFDHVKYDKVDQIMEGNTVEIRCGNGCKNPIIIQNYVNFLLSLFRYAKSDKFNDELIDKRHEMCKDIYGNIDMYDEIYLEQAIELIDEIFDNNLDKIYFLNQYLKDFKVDKKKFDKNKTFTKK